MTARDKARQHAKHPHPCSCGRVVFGNGGKYQHAEMHKRRNDGHHWITITQWQESNAEPEGQ